jgi:uroporphyrinogen-III decarboxylase
MTTGMDRLTAAINGTPSDRIPVFCNLLDQGARELGVSLEQYYASGERVAEAQLRMRERYGHDNVWSLFYVGKEAELFGCSEILFTDDGPPNVADFVIKGPADVARLQVPEDIASHPAFAEPKRCLEILRREVGGKYPICAYITASMALPALLMGMDRWLQLLLMGPEDVRDQLLEKCHLFFTRELEAYRAAGADVLVYSNPFGSTDIVPMRLFHKLSLPWIERDIAAVGTAGVVYYCGMARFNPVIEIVRERTGIGTYYLSPFDDVTEGKRAAGRTSLTCGVINDIRMIDREPAEIRREVNRIVAAGMPGNHFLFGTGVMPFGIPETNIRTMLEAAFEFGSLAA